MVPIPNAASNQDITVDTLPGYVIIRIGTIEVHAAASATPSRNLKHKRKSSYKKQHEKDNILNKFVLS